MAHKIIERVEACYETREVLFGRVYEWHPAYVALECDCSPKDMAARIAANRLRTTWLKELRDGWLARSPGGRT